MPRWRTCRSPTVRGRLRQQRRVAARPKVDAATSACVVIAPIDQVVAVDPDARAARRSPPRSTSRVGAASRSRSTGSRLCPPARTLASSPAAAERRDRLLHRGRAGRSRTRPGSCGTSVDLAQAARHTRSACSGMWMSLTPRGRSASTTALTTAGVEAMVPASPTPLAPSGCVVAGVSVRSVMTSGRSAALGSRYSANEPVSRLPLVVVHGLLEQRLGDALGDAAVHLALDDQRVDHLADVVDGHVLADRDPAGLGVHLGRAQVRAVRERERGGSKRGVRVQRRLHAVGQVVRGEHGQRALGERLAPPRGCPGPGTRRR